MGIHAGAERASGVDVRALLEASPTPCLVLIPDFTVVAVNEAYLRATLRVGEEILGRSLFDVFPGNPSDPGATGGRELKESLERVVRTGAPDTMAIKKHDIPGPGSGGQVNEERYVRPINAPVFGEAGELRYIMHRVEDVTELVRSRGAAAAMAAEIAAQAREIQAANARLREAQQELEARVHERTIELARGVAELRQIADSMPQIVWTARPDGHVDYFNERWYQYTGRPRDQHGDASWEPAMHPDDLPQLRAEWRAALETGQRHEVKVRLRNGFTGEYRWHLARAVPVRDDDGRIFRWFGTTTDIEDQMRVVQQLEQERDLRERFVQSLTHDLRSPLSAARMSAAMLGRKASDPAAVQRLAGRIVGTLDRIDRMIRDLLDVSRIKAGEAVSLDVQRCDLGEIARSTLEDLATVHGDRFVLHVDPPIEGHWCCHGLRRIIENLCVNAVKYGDPGRPVTVRVKKEAQQVRIEVHNSGKAITPEDQASLFQPFRRTAEARSGGQRGWGIGLALVRAIATAHGGSVGVESSPERGTTFRVVLPVDARSKQELAELSA